MEPIYKPDFLSPPLALSLFNSLWNDLPWERREDAPRREIWFNSQMKPYTYGKGPGLRTYQPHNPVYEVNLVNLLMRFNTGTPKYEGCFVNGYEDGHDSLGWHSDDDPGIDHAYPIAVVTLGQSREIMWRGEDTGKQLLEDGSLFLMPAGFQSGHQHRIPKAGYACKPRISLTFRKLL